MRRHHAPVAGRRIQHDELPAKARVDTPVELEYYRHGGILPTVLRKLAADSQSTGATPLT